MTIVIAWPGKSGAKYETELFPIGTQFNAVSGVYIVCKPGVSPGYWTPLYVGEAKSLYDRLNAGVATHDGMKCAAGRGSTHVAVMRTYDDATRLRIETDLRHGLVPPCNKQSVPVRAVRLGA